MALGDDIIVLKCFSSIVQQGVKVSSHGFQWHGRVTIAKLLLSGNVDVVLDNTK